MSISLRKHTEQAPHRPVIAGVFELFKIGVGPSSSHTMGPMNAARQFAEYLISHKLKPARICATAYGSLAWTGIGHRTDKAIILGLAGYRPETFNAAKAKKYLAKVSREQTLLLAGRYTVTFKQDTDLVLDKKTPTPFHPNTMRFEAFAEDGSSLCMQEWISPGGGSTRCLSNPDHNEDIRPLEYEFCDGAELLALADATGKSLAQIAMGNELGDKSEAEVLAGIDEIISVMFASINEGLTTGGILPGGLEVRRRAQNLFEMLEAKRAQNDISPSTPQDYVAAFAMAVNEVNAAGGRIVTAPTNGAAGVVPSVLRYYKELCAGAHHQGMRDFILTAAIIGAIIKQRASISGAEVGCQGEVGSASAMAAAGLCAALGGTNEQVENAAEMALEHHLGMTCDPVGGLVQIPCIERNAFGALKAIAAASLALHGDGEHHVSFDQVVETMRQTGLDMGSKYKETSRGGLAANVPAC